MLNTISSIISKGKEKISESLPKVWSAIANTFSKYKEIGNRWRQKTVSERAKTYYGKWREEAKSDFTYFNMNSLKEAFKTIWTKPKALLRDPLKWLTVGTMMTLWWAAVSSIPNTAMAAGQWMVATGKGVIWVSARVVEWIAKWWIGMADSTISSIADKFDVTSGWSAPAPKADKPAEKKEEKKPESKK